MATAAIVDLLNFRNFNRQKGQDVNLRQGTEFRGRKGQGRQTASSYEISWRMVKLMLRYGEFSIFPRRQQSAILDL